MLAAALSALSCSDIQRSQGSKQCCPSAASAHKREASFSACSARPKLYSASNASDPASRAVSAPGTGQASLLRSGASALALGRRTVSTP